MLLVFMIFALTLIATSAFLIKRVVTERDVIILNVLITLGLVTSAFFVLMQKDIDAVFKVSFLYAGLFFIYNYSERFHVIERISILTALIGIFTMMSSSSDTVTVISSFLILVSVYGFIITRERPNKSAVTAVSTILIILLMYKLAPAIVIIFLLLVTLAFPFKTKNASLEALITTLVTPVLIFLSLKYLSQATNVHFLTGSLRIIGISLMAAAPILLFSNSYVEKRMAKYGVFYLGNIIFLLSMHSKQAYILAVIYTLIIAIIYDPKRSTFSIFNLAMLPPSPAFIVKLSFLSELTNNFHPAYQIVIILSSIAVMFHASVDIYKIGIKRPLILKIVSIAAIIVVLIYLKQLETVLAKVIGVFAG